MAQGGPAPLPTLRPRGLVSKTTPTADWPEILKAVALEVLGQPAERRSNQWRYGRHGSLALHVGSWRDFEAGRGGGVNKKAVLREGSGKLLPLSSRTQTSKGVSVLVHRAWAWAAPPVR